MKQGVLLAPYTTFKIGGPADYFEKANTTHELIEAISFAKRQKIPYFILGKGSNILVSDDGFRGLVIKIQDTRFKIQEARIFAASGLPLRKLVDLAAANCLTGLEFLVGIPGSVGGAIRGNAGAWQQGIGDKVDRVQILNDQAKTCWLNQTDCQFSYRGSRFKKSREIILAVELQLTKGDPQAIKAKMADYLQRRSGQPKQPSAGCIFVNPKPEAAGRLIEECGLKGRQIGQAQISPHHANFIVNLGGARASEVLTLIKLAKKAVKEKFRIDLELEIQLVGLDYV